jgi:hypothetical protein
MKDIILLLTSLAEKFGTTVEHLWSVLVKQAAIYATANIALTLVSVIVWVCMFVLVQRKTRAPKETKENPYPVPEWTHEGAAIAWLVVAVATALAIFQVYHTIEIVITATMNPEYWALQQVLSLKN